MKGWRMMVVQCGRVIGRSDGGSADDGVVLSQDPVG